MLWDFILCAKYESNKVYAFHKLQEIVFYCRKVTSKIITVINIQQNIVTFGIYQGFMWKTQQNARCSMVFLFFFRRTVWKSLLLKENRKKYFKCLEGWVGFHLMKLFIK